LDRCYREIFLFLLLPRTVFPKQIGRVAIVTGGAKGMGYETARHLTSLGMHVVIAGNSEEEGLAAVRKIREENSKGKGNSWVCRNADQAAGFLSPFLQPFLDLSSLKSVRQFVRMFKDRRLPLHILVNNAGVMLVPERQTEDGFELHFGLNYLGHFLLTNLLLDTLKQSGSHDSCARVVTVSSATHYVGVLNLEDLQSRSCYCAHGAYAQSKLALVLFSYHLQQKLTAGGFPVTVNVVDPGMVNTDLYQNLCSPAQLVKRPVAWLLFRTPAEGASTAIYAAASPTMEGVGGCYLYNGQRAQSSIISYDEDLQAQLWSFDFSLSWVDMTLKSC
uniref:Polyprenol dehydrogenase n=1 Tax=Scleropages formosus TaxID=113540 RepID=A0A8C9R5I6_SCLFO